MTHCLSQHPAINYFRKEHLKYPHTPVFHFCLRGALSVGLQAMSFDFQLISSGFDCDGCELPMCINADQKTPISQIGARADLKKTLTKKRQPCGSTASHLLPDFRRIHFFTLAIMNWSDNCNYCASLCLGFLVLYNIFWKDPLKA